MYNKATNAFLVESGRMPKVSTSGTRCRQKAERCWREWDYDVRETDARKTA